MSTSLEISAHGTIIRVLRRTFVVDVDRDLVHEMGPAEAESLRSALDKAIEAARRNAGEADRKRGIETGRKIAALKDELAELERAEKALGLEASA